MATMGTTISSNSIHSDISEDSSPINDVTPNEIHILSSTKNNESNTAVHDGPPIQSNESTNYIARNDSPPPALGIVSNDTTTNRNNETRNSQTTGKDATTELSSHNLKNESKTNDQSTKSSTASNNSNNWLVFKTHSIPQY